MHKLNTFLRMPLRQKLLFLEALTLSLYFSIRMRVTPFHKLSKHLGIQGLETAMVTKDLATLRSIAHHVSLASRHALWPCACMVQAMTARHMLKTRRLSSTLYMGARRNEQGVMEAHAWLRSGAYFVTGGDGSRLYAVTSLYGTEIK